MTDADLIVNTIALFPNPAEVSFFRNFFTQLRMSEADAWGLLAKVIKKHRGKIGQGHETRSGRDEVTPARFLGCDHEPAPAKRMRNGISMTDVVDAFSNEHFRRREPDLDAMVDEITEEEEEESESNTSTNAAYPANRNYAEQWPTLTEIVGKGDIASDTSTNTSCSVHHGEIPLRRKRASWPCPITQWITSAEILQSSPRESKKQNAPAVVRAPPSPATEGSVVIVGQRPRGAAWQSPSGYPAPEKKKSVVIVEGVLVDGEHIENHGAAIFSSPAGGWPRSPKRNPDIILRWCLFHPNCESGDECGYVHLKLHPRRGNHLDGVPIYANLEGKMVATDTLKPTKCLDLLRTRPQLKLKRCQQHPCCKHGPNCTFAHI